MTIRKDGIYFKDEYGRVLTLHGVNVSGTVKIPITPNGATHMRENFFKHQDVSFIGRPFPLARADEHFTRLKHWGFDFLRFLTTWEAIEHAGPGQYDEDYLAYLEALIDKAAEYDINLFIDYHQDVWSRFSGGDGAPGWTFEKIGMEMRHFEAAGAALVHQIHGDPYPKMRWATNYTKLAAATMFTLFFAGNDFAPETRIDGESAQDYLQGRYLDMLAMMAKRFKDKSNVIGYDLINEPSRGYIGLHNIRKLEWTLRTGEMPTPYQSMLLGAGYAQDVDIWSLNLTGQRRVDTRIIDPKGVSIWKEGVEPIWKQNGVWDVDSHEHPILLQPDYFESVNGRRVSFEGDYMPAFIDKASQVIHQQDPDAMIFIEFDAMEHETIPAWDKSQVNEDNIVYAPHWYPTILLMTKRYIPWMGVNREKLRPVFGRMQKREVFANDLYFLKHISENSFHGVPTVIGEIGIPYDLNNREGYLHNKWDNHIRAIDDYMYALEKNLLHYTIWNYTPDNNNSRGDLWNGEDLSIFSYDQQTEPSKINSGGRALIALVRPYARATAGVPKEMHFTVETGTFYFEFEHDESITQPTEIYVPQLQYPNGFDVRVSDGTYEYDQATQCLRYHHSKARLLHKLTIVPIGERDIFVEEERRNRSLIYLSALTGILLTILVFFRSRSDD